MWELFKGLGCCRAHGCGPRISQHFGDASVEVVAGAVLRTWACVCVAGAAFGSCLKGWGVVARAAVGSILRGARSTLEMQVLKSWQAQFFVHLGLRLRGRGIVWELSKGLGCCGARGCGPHLPWQAQRFGGASAEIVAGAVLRGPGLALAWQGQHLGAV